jgi:transposase
VHRSELPELGEPEAQALMSDAVALLVRDHGSVGAPKFPMLAASRLYVMVHERGYRGSPHHFRHLIACLRPRPKAEAFLRLRTLPGEQAQVDWAHFGHLVIGRARRPLMAFVMVLSYSRQIFLRFFLNARMENFLRGHVEAFEAWSGVPKVILYDNLKSAVLERQGNVIRFHPTLFEFAGRYRFDPRPVAVARGNEKGRVERAIRYVRSSFFAAREFADLDDLNAQADVWCRGLAAQPDAGHHLTGRDPQPPVKRSQSISVPLNHCGNIGAAEPEEVVLDHGRAQLRLQHSQAHTSA